ncbi:GntR family transcriptional regulator [Sphingomonas immobilis]|uniref:GntR family transcriptional regulator n=1 Tax=Sphingomonas immobilis TaxID=3063997 RepID=A0ABT9A2L0_9SPHN|nr:GntR family transcriptional regulator [Sphingomonas sp. CA1-15]MDO7843589.1 GntR family transcriptional regulator [Sphingomonas sp. CA1-15]
MNAAGATSERVYDALKQRILSGEILPGERLEPAAFAEQLNSSVTPVRDALHRLEGERLVDTRASEGFHLRMVSEPALRDLYAWNAQLLRLTARAWPDRPAAHKADTLPIDLQRAIRAFFDLFAARSDNSEHGEQLDNINDRLASARVAEARVFDGLEAELRGLALLFDHEGTTALLKGVDRYHRRRLAATPAIVRALYRA